jgi:CRP-like cAMP-binding protein
MVDFIKSSHCRSCDECNRKSQLLQHLTDEQLDRVNGNRYEVRFKAGETMVKQGATITNILHLTSGMAKMYIEGVGGRNMIMRLFKPWELIGGSTIYYDVRYHFSVAAVEDTTACFIDIGVFKEMLYENRAFAEAYLYDVAKCSNFCIDRMVSLIQKQMHGRMADALLYFMQDIYQSNPFQLTLGRQDIGDMTAMSKDSAIRILKEFENDGIIKMNGKSVEVTNPNHLKEISIRG